MPGMKNGVYPTGDATPPSVCAEPGAVSSFIKKWEDQNNGGRQLDPSKPKDANKIKKCLGSINSVAAQQTDGKDRAPCPNCSQLIQTCATGGECRKTEWWRQETSWIEVTPMWSRADSPQDARGSRLPTRSGDEGRWNVDTTGTRGYPAERWLWATRCEGISARGDWRHSRGWRRNVTSCIQAALPSFAT